MIVNEHESVMVGTDNALQGWCYPHELFEVQAQRFPEELAVSCVDHQLTYRELDRLSNQLAHVLRKYGIGPECYVGLCFPRSVEMVVALLAVLKAGGAYVPLEPGLPDARLLWQLQNSGARLLLTHTSLSGSFVSFEGKVVCLDQLHFAHESDRSPEVERSPDQAAYTIYTSGSTGQPKGVIISLRSLMNYLCAMDRALHLEPGIQMAMVSTLAADLGSIMLYGALLCGGGVHILPYEMLVEGDRFAQYTRQHPIDIMKIVPSHLRALLSSTSSYDFLPRRHLILAGEAFSLDLLEQLRALKGSTKLANHYGPTETTVSSLTYPLAGRIDDVLCSGVKSVPIGYPIPNMETLVLDESLQPVTDGMAGELYLAGAGLARGYQQQPAQTAERFLPHPYKAGMRMYKTGDRVCVTGDGSIEFLGRVDNQIKIRGYRIELGEIEAELNRHPALKEAVVVVREDTPGNKRLVTYMVARTHMARPSIEELRTYLKEKLPAYMIPSAFLYLEVIPLNTNGKVDRQALLQIPQETAEREPAETACSTLEKRLQEMWYQVLGIEQIGIHENFFECGGHSLLAMRIAARIRKELQIDLSVQTIFECPTIAQQAHSIESLEQTSCAAQTSLMIPPRPAQLPLSFAQQRLWFLHQFEPESPFYNISLAFQLRGPLQVAILQRSLLAIVQRHEALRTIFVQEDGKPIQHILEALPLQLHSTNLCALPITQREEQLRHIVEEEARQPFDLEQGPLLRARLLSMSAEEHVLILTVHHVVFDGWSQYIFMRELASYYTAFSQDAMPSPHALPLQMADYALWQQEWLQGAVLEEQLAYWRERLRGAPATLNLPMDRPRPAIQSFRGDVHRFALPANMKERLNELCREEGVTLFMLLIATFDLLLARYSGQDDIVVGSPVANRRHVDFEELIGFFANTLVLRNDLSGNPTFRAFLHSVRQRTLEAYKYQDVPLEKIVQELAIERTPGMNPLFQVVFVLQNTLMPDQKLGDLELNWLEVHNGTAKFDMVLELTETATSIQGKCEYSTDLFDTSTIARFIQHFQVVLENVLVNPDAPLSALSLLSPDERTLLLETWTATKTAYPRESRIQDLFAEQVALRGDAVALVYEDHQLTYHELDCRANRLAWRLRQMGVGPEVPVGICIERSLEQLVGVLGILKSGGIYVPIDPHYPEERLRYMVEDAQVGVLLTQCARRAHWPEQSMDIVCLDEAYGEGLECDVAPESGATTDNLAYIIYTSGSTGKPKGVCVQQKSVVRLVKETNYMRFSAHDVFLQFAPVSFDASTLEIWGCLLNGARLVIAPARDISLHELAQLIERQQITTAWLTAGLFHQMVEFHLDSLLGMQQLLAGGDVLSVAHVRKFLARSRGCTLINGYGPTENTTFTCCYPLSPGEQIGSSVPIGRPISNSQVYILDDQLQPVSIGVSGGLYIAGDGLARGYLQRPELTAERFIPNPYSREPGGRLYSTGDSARYRPNGTIDFLGRTDHQVKLRGFRIELGEIEVALSAHDAVQDAVVVAREDSPGDKYLAAYVIITDGKQLEKRQLLAWIQERLPAYMVPRGIVFLETFPLSANGKVDRRALPQLQEEATEHESGGKARSALEEIIEGIWCQVLGVQQINVHENFFQRGGHSLLATQIIARIHQSLQIDLPLRTLFEQPTIRELAQHIELMQHDQGKQMLALSPLVPSKKPALLPLSFAQRRLWFLNLMEPESSFYNIRMAYQLQGSVDAQMLEMCLREIVQRHDILRTCFVMTQGEPYQVVQPARYPILNTIRLAASPREQRELQEIIDTERGQTFNLEQGPLLRATLVYVDEVPSVLIFSFHHIVFDGWSQEVFLRELVEIYAALCQGQSSPLPALTLQYADYALWQHAWLTEAVLEQQLVYWRERLEGAEKVLHLPTDRPRPAIQTFRGTTWRSTLPAHLNQALRKLSQREGVTLFMTLLGAFEVLLYRYTGQRTILLGAPTANRRQVELEGLLGFFVNTLILRADLSPEQSFQQVVQQVRDTVLSADAHQDLPFEKLVEALHPERSLSHNPLFQVAFGFVSSSNIPLRLGEAALRPLAIGSRTAKQDLMLNIVETEEGLYADWEYNTDLFEQSTIERMKGHYQSLLEAVVADPLRPISRLGLLTQQEQQTQLVQWNETTLALDSGLLAHQLIAAHSALHPERTALTFQDQRLSYQQMQQRVLRLAYRLQAAGVGPEVRVGICLPRGLPMLIAVLAVLNAGGAYVPLDPAYPQERLSFMINDAGLHLVLSQPAVLEGFSDWSWPTWFLDNHEPDPEDLWEEPPLLNQLHEQNTAYVIYTSGSTGKPKGVMVSHRGLRHLVHAQRAVFGNLAGQHVLQFASLSFDASIWEIVMALCNGGSLHLASRETLLSASELQQVLQRQAVSMVTLSPSVLAALSEETLAGIETLITAGEACSAEAVERWSPGRRMYNAYGPTETTVWASIEQCQVGQGRPTIGRVIPNMQGYVLDARMEPVPVGMEGELYVGGMGVARGYLGRAELTAERYVPNPWSQQAGERLYRTGDVVRYREDGKLEYRGRRDQQVKVRGYRIELGEIEEELRKEQDVKEAVVIVREEGSEKRLVGYVVGEAGLDGQALRERIRERLPQHMVPSAIVVLDRLPVTPNAKVDLRALPAPETVQREISEEFSEPDTQIERDIATLWRELLNIEKVSVHDNFFDLGGHSLLLTRLHSRLKEVLQRHIALLDLFQHTTIRAQATYLSSLQQDEAQLKQTQSRAVVRNEALKQRREQRQNRQSRQEIRYE